MMTTQDILMGSLAISILKSGYGLPPISHTNINNNDKINKISIITCAKYGHDPCSQGPCSPSKHFWHFLINNYILVLCGVVVS